MLYNKPMKQVDKSKTTSNLKFNDDYSQKIVDVSKTINRRLKVSLIVIILVFSIIWLNIYSIQIVRQDEFTDKLITYTSSFQSVASPRGEIYDRNGNILVTNSERLSIVYFPPQGISDQSEWELALAFSKHFTVDTSILNARDLKDLYIIKYSDQASAKISKSEWNDYYSGKLNDDDIYQMKLDRISELEYNQFTDLDKASYIVKTAMQTSPANNLKIIKENCTLEEVSYLVEHNEDYKGFDVRIFYDRSYPNNDLLRTLLGNVTTNKQGLISEKLEYYLALGYERNASIGKSGIELMYENLLKGENSLYSIQYNPNTSLASFIETYKGTKGQDLTLSFDMDLQLKVEEIVKKYLLIAKEDKYRRDLEKMYVVVMNPKTGDVLSLVGMKNDKGVFYNDPVSTYTEALAPGSSIKGSIVYMGLNEGVIKPGEYISDVAIKIKDTPLKKSWRYLGTVNDLTALSMSSNVFMFHVAMRLAKAKYTFDGPLDIPARTFTIVREYMSQFGLGTLTGLDVPNEALGYYGTSTLAGHILDMVIGQYDTFTPIQLAQYISTIANNGTRVKPRILLEAKQSNTDIVTYQNPVTVLSVLSNSKALLRVQSGFRLCVTSGICTIYNTLPVAVAAKTGTAEVPYFVKGKVVESANHIVVTYAPYDNPVIAMSCAAPNSWTDVSRPNICTYVTKEIYAYYFSKK